MDNVSDEVLKAGADLATIALKNTVTLIDDRIRAMKTKKDLAKQNTELQEIINDLLGDKAALLRVAQIYEQELTSQKITDEDIEYITKNIFPILENSMPKAQSKNLQHIKSIFSKETLTILQLVGFNYKKAIGEPLTHFVCNFIESKIQKETEDQVNHDAIIQTMAELSKDENAFKRFKELANLGHHNE